MADLRRKLAGNVDGLFFVDDTCIDCDTCRQLAPEIFSGDGTYSVVSRQPVTELEIRHASRSLLSCPTGSIGTTAKLSTLPVMDDFPIRIDDEVYYNGFASKHSYGASSYFVKHSGGNWLIDSPKFMPHLVKKYEALGGLHYIFLSHRDDVADAERYAAHFGAQRIIHRFELSAQPGAEIVIDGLEPLSFGPDFLVIPTPGHTRGHCVLLHKEKFLFTGDHLWWSRSRTSIIASRSVCWYSWAEQTHSMEQLLRYRFEWILPGHGERAHFSVENMNRALGELTFWMNDQK